MKGWERQEKRIAKATGGKRTAASGALSHKGDIRADGVLVEAKWTGKTQYTIKAAEVEKNVREAILIGRLPVFHIELNGREYALVEWDELLALLEKQ